MRTMLLLLSTSSFFGALVSDVDAGLRARRAARRVGGIWVSLMSGVGSGRACRRLRDEPRPHDQLHRVPMASAALFGLFLIFFSQSTDMILSLALLVPAGAGLMMQGISTNTLIQTVTTDAMRGRVMAYYVMAFMGMMPLGALAAGWLSHQIGVPETVAFGGAACIACAGVARLLSRK